MSKKLYDYEGPEKGSWGKTRNIECPYCSTSQEVSCSILTSSCIKCKKTFELRDYIFNKTYHFGGKIVTRGSVIIEEAGSVKASLSATNVIIKGILIGNVKAVEKVELYSGGELYGNINAKHLIVLEGATLQGYCEIKRK